MNLITPLLVAATTTIGITSAQEMCSCSPTVFTFTLSLDQGCEDNTIEDNPGIDGSFCFTENGVAAPEPPAPSIRKLQDTTAENAVIADQSTTDGECSCSPPKFIFKLALSAACPALPPPFPPNDVFGAGVKDYTCTIGPEPIPSDSEVEELQSSINVTNLATIIESASAADTVPVSIYSIQFLEVDKSFNVINQDSKYVRGIDFQDGDIFEYDSILSDPDPSNNVVPYGMNMVLRGVNAAGEPVRNVFTITYTQDCGIHTFQEGDTIGWVIFDDLGPATPETCGPSPVTEIVSVQFFEFDTSGDLTVINQDDTYADVSLSNGDQLKFDSASRFLDTSLPLEDQMSSPALVPGGASLILYGKTESGVVVRNRFFWMYDMNCGNENSPVNVDDKIGWVKVSEIANAWPTFCPALPAGSPTISPRSNEPTLTPSKSPTLKPSNNPTKDKKGKGKANGIGYGVGKDPKACSSKKNKKRCKKDGCAWDSSVKKNACSDVESLSSLKEQVDGVNIQENSAVVIPSATQKIYSVMLVGLFGALYVV